MHLNSQKNLHWNLYSALQWHPQALIGNPQTPQLQNSNKFLTFLLKGFLYFQTPLIISLSTHFLSLYYSVYLSLNQNKNQQKQSKPTFGSAFLCNPTLLAGKSPPESCRRSWVYEVTEWGNREGRGGSVFESVLYDCFFLFMKCVCNFVSVL